MRVRSKAAGDLAGAVALAGAPGAGAAVAVAWNDWGLRVAGRCELLPHPAMRVSDTTVVAAAMRIRCINPSFPEGKKAIRGVFPEQDG